MLPCETPPISALSQDFENAYARLALAIEILVECYRETPMPIWVHSSLLPAQRWLEAALRDNWYRDGQAGNESTPYVGLVGALPRHVEAIHGVNQAKYVLQVSGKMLKAQSHGEFLEAKRRLGSEREQMQPALNAAGLARLHLKQAWRRLPLAEQAVRRVHFSWYSSGRTIKRMTVREVEAALCRLDTTAPHIRIQLARLAALPAGEVLAQVKPQTRIMRANVTYFDPLPALRMHQAMNVTMPLFVPLQEGQALPEHNQPSESPPTQRQWPKRCDARLEDEPYLPSVHVHRYRDVAES